MQPAPLVSTTIPVTPTRSRRSSHHREAKMQLKSGLDDIKRHIYERKNRYYKELKDRTGIIERSEKELANIAPKCSDRWRKIQKKIWFISLLRRVLRNARNFGIDPYKMPEMTVADVIPKPQLCYIIYPGSRFSRVHVILLLIVMVYLVIVFPLDLAFDLEARSAFWGIVDNIITGFFAFDILVSFLTAYEVKGVLIDDWKTIAKNYLLKWFVLDVLTVFPFFLLMDERSFRFKRLLKLPRLLRIANSMFQNTESKRKTRSLIVEKLKYLFSSSKNYFIVHSLLLVVTFIHFGACLWCFLLGLDDTNWLTGLQLQNHDNDTEVAEHRQYLLAVYYIIATIATVGFGDVSAKNNSSFQITQSKKASLASLSFLEYGSIRTQFLSSLT